MAAAGTDDFIEWRRYIITRRIVTAGALVGALAAHILVGRWRARRQSGTKSRKQDKRTHAASKSAAAPARVAGKGGKGGGAAPGNNKKDKKRKAEKKEAALAKRREESAAAAERRAAEERQKRLEETPDSMKHFSTSITYKVSARHASAMDRAHAARGRAAGSGSSGTKSGDAL